MSGHEHLAQALAACGRDGFTGELRITGTPGGTFHFGDGRWSPWSRPVPPDPRHCCCAPGGSVASSGPSWCGSPAVRAGRPPRSSPTVTRGPRSCVWCARWPCTTPRSRWQRAGWRTANAAPTRSRSRRSPGRAAPAAAAGRGPQTHRPGRAAAPGAPRPGTARALGHGPRIRVPAARVAHARRRPQYGPRPRLPGRARCLHRDGRGRSHARGGAPGMRRTGHAHRGPLPSRRRRTPASHAHARGAVPVPDTNRSAPPKTRQLLPAPKRNAQMKKPIRCEQN